MSCKKGGFGYIRHSDLRDLAALTANMMSEVSKDTEIKPKLTPLFGEEMQGKIVEQLKRGKGRYQDSRFQGTRATGIFRLKCFQPQRLLLSQQLPAAVPCYE